MQTAKIFKNGNFQAEGLPKKSPFDVNEVEVLQRNNEIILRKNRPNLAEAFELLSSLPDDFYNEARTDLLPKQREPF